MNGRRRKTCCAETETSHDGLTAALCAVLCCAVLGLGSALLLPGCTDTPPAPGPMPQTQYTPSHVDVNGAYALQGVFRRRDHRQAMLHKTGRPELLFPLSSSGCKRNGTKTGRTATWRAGRRGSRMYEIEGYSFHFGRLAERHNPNCNNETPSHGIGDAVVIMSRG